jgi:hypothetical protein
LGCFNIGHGETAVGSGKEGGRLAGRFGSLLHPVRLRQLCPMCFPFYLDARSSLRSAPAAGFSGFHSRDCSTEQISCLSTLTILLVLSLRRQICRLASTKKRSAFSSLIFLHIEPRAKLKFVSVSENTVSAQQRFKPVTDQQ